MSKTYQPLHQKYRPKRFDDLVGQDSIVATLKQALISNRIAPAYLFCGPRGTGKTSSARILARSLNCQQSEKPTIAPCCQCNLCKEIGKGTALDIIEIDAASNTGVDNIRELIERSQFAPVQARWKVYVIDECHMLSTAAFNALLKTLEEPPSQTVFVLATTDPQRLLQTILSRCQRFDFRRIPITSLTSHLTTIASKEKIEIDQESINLIAQRSEGGLRDAESLLDQLSLLKPPINLQSIWELLGEVPENDLIILTSSLISQDPISLLKTCRKLFDNGKEPISILQGLTATLRDLVLIKSLPDQPSLCSLSKQSQETLTKISSELELDRILYWQKYLKGSESQIRFSLQPRLWLEVLLLGLLSNPNISEKKASKNIQEVKVNANNTLNNDHVIEKQILNTDESVRQEVTADNEQSKSGLLSQWEQILSQIELPSTRMLLSQQARLTNLTKNQAEISISENWLGMIQSRKNIIQKAIRKCLGENIELSLIQQSKLNTPSIEVDDKNLLTEKNIKDRNLKLDSNKLNNNNTSSKLNDVISEETENFANFFNGKIIDLEGNE
ncbi:MULTISPECIES: DNA polymerase III subunit gamma/tau [Prochlorococcus]|uniref:DNA polymerase III subunit gamma/tau n=1 Tax=Prochlorococcus marinus (strain SARG / CCMP1375 / SS120) TaxID=167539 RepID=Q7V9L4_PROMA|nr:MULTISPECIES: DNA polymerase III subunit gamma/tau [Prochlorococcus]AAQ00862.1 DNA polymerase III gamma/tau subunit [Prochlorococcus marinus subsp. marinus str. CCMP1375]KGG10643.1 DNA polymerasee III subunits gamma and tau [Prochlorococcus marinus str. LG]KGG19891.1 DNA polymerasee III subunits gamma and tau [Prochlorococcus marinus str. SS2]KGG23889.1 DNA polymerasee III subunits gamma and tau [Prochlorococcus marinus str. SS35]KGG31851.1 DNA polymerasee III subunits gamma and tau [Prochl